MNPQFYLNNKIYPNKMKIYYLLFISILIVSCSTNIKIVDKPIIFDEERETLTLQYLSERYDINNGLLKLFQKW